MLESQIHQRPSCQCCHPETAGAAAQGVFLIILCHISGCKVGETVWRKDVLRFCQVFH